MSAFVISKRQDEKYEFKFASRRGNALFTSIPCREKSDCELIITAIKDNTSSFTFTKTKLSSKKYYFRLSRNGLVLATSRKFSTERMLQKGIDQILTYVPTAEILDFSENELIFSDTDATAEEQS